MTENTDRSGGEGVEPGSSVDRELIDDSDWVLDSLTAGATPGDRLILSRTRPNWLKGPCDEWDYSPGFCISWQDVERRHGGGEYRLILMRPGNKGLKGSKIITIPGPAKYKGQYVTSEDDVDRIVKGTGTADQGVGALAEALKGFGQTIAAVLAESARQQSENTKLILQSLGDLRGNQRDSLSESIKSLAGIQKLVQGVQGIQRAAGSTMAPVAVQAAVAEVDESNPLGGILESVGPTITGQVVNRLIDSFLGPAPVNMTPKADPLSPAESAELDGNGDTEN